MSSRTPAQQVEIDVDAEVDESVAGTEFSLGVSKIENSLKDYDKRVTAFRRKAVQQLSKRDYSGKGLKVEFVQLEDDYIELISQIESTFALFNDEDLSVALDIELPSVIKLYQRFVSSMLTLSNSKAVMLVVGQSDGFEDWLKRFRLRVPSKIFHYAFGGHIPFKSQQWQKDFNIFVTEKTSSLQGEFYFVSLNPHFLAGAIRGFQVGRSVDDEGLFAIAQYVAMDRLQMAWRNLQFFRGVEFSPLPYTAELRAKYQDLNLSENMSMQDTAFYNRNLDVAYIVSEYKKQQETLPSFHDDEFLNDIREILYLDGEETPEDQRWVLADSFRDGIASIKAEQREAHFAHILSNYSLDVSVFSGEEIQHAIHLILVRSYISADISSFMAHLSDLRNRYQHLDEDLADVSQAKISLVEKRMILQGAKYLEALEQARAFPVTKEDFYVNRRNQNARQMGKYVKDVMRHVRMLSGREDAGVHMGSMALALSSKVEGLEPSFMLSQYYKLFANFSDYNSGLHYYARVLKVLQDEMADFVLAHSIASKEEIDEKKQAEEAESALEEFFKDMASAFSEEETQEEESSEESAPVVSENGRSFDQGLVFVFDEEGKLVKVADQAPEHNEGTEATGVEEASASEDLSVKDLKPLSLAVPKAYQKYLTLEQRKRLRWSPLSAEEFETVLAAQMKDIENWQQVGEIFGFRGDVARLSYNIGPVLSGGERGLYKKVHKNELISHYPFLALNIKNSEKTLYEELNVISLGRSDLDPKVTLKISEAFGEVEEGLLKSWEMITTAKDFEDLEHVMLNNPLLQERIKAAFPEYESLQKVVANRLKLPNAYEEHFGSKMEKLNYLIIVPMVVMQLARWTIGSRMPGAGAALLPIIEAWQASIPGFYWALWGADFVAGQANMIADTGLGFRLGWGERGPTILPSQLIEETQTFFFSSVRGTPIIEPDYYEGIRKEHIAAVKGTYFHLALDTYIFTSMAFSMKPQIDSIRAKFGRGAGQ